MIEMPLPGTRAVLARAEPNWMGCFKEVVPISCTVIGSDHNSPHIVKIKLDDSENTPIWHVDIRLLDDFYYPLVGHGYNNIHLAQELPK